MEPLLRVFISYAREDLKTARQMFLELGSITGVRPWLDVECLLAGADWAHDISEALERSELVVVLLSSSAIDRTGYIQKELRTILDRQLYRPPGEIYVIPVRLDDCKPKHPELQRLHYIDLFGGWDRCLTQIRRIVNQKRKIFLGILPQHISVGPPDFRTISGFLTTFTWKESGKVYVIHQGRNYIGSGGIIGDDRLCDVFVPDDPQLSATHALILSDQGSFEIYDLGSKNGTFVDGELLVPLRSSELLNGSQIRTGETSWLFVKVPSGLESRKSGLDAGQHRG